MNALTVKIGSDISELRTGMAKAQDLVKGFQGTIESVAGSIGIAFGVQQVGSFALELTKLAGQVDGVKQAFDKLQGSAQVLSDLKTATRGTVSEFDLMKAAVQASNFKIPIEQLGSLFNFAYERAKATGQSVDYLVNSIVVGIGRKSPLILDNLGISAVELKDRLKGVSTEAATVGDVAKAVGAIASDAMAQMGASAETAAEKVAQIGAKWDDIKAKFGSIIADKVTKGPDGLLNNISNQLIVWQSNQFSFWQKLLGSAKEYQDMVNQINQSADAAATRNVQNSQGLTLSAKDPFAAIRAKYANAGTQDTGLAGALRRRNSASSGLPTSDIEGQSVNPSFLRDLGSDLDGLQKKVDGFNMDNLRQQWEQSAEATKNLGAAVSQLGDAVGQGLGAAISGTVSFGQAMAQMASQVVASLERMALAYMIENNAKFGLPGIALAAIGFGAIKSLFAKIGSGGGGSGSVPATTSQRATAPVYQERLVTNISGQNLAVVLQRYQDSNSYTRPVGG